MQLNNLLLDDIQMFEPKPTFIFTDQKRQVAIEVCTLSPSSVAFNFIDLDINSWLTGFNADLHGLAKNTIDKHDPNCKK